MSTDSINQNPDNSNALQVVFENHPVRILKADNGELMFIASFVCEALGLGNISAALSRLDEDEKGIISDDTPGGRQNVAYVTEPGLYTLVMASRKPEAKRFKRWIAHDVLPELRKNNRYEIPKDLSPIEKSRQLLNVLVSIQDTVEAQQHLLNEHDERIASLEAHVQPELEYFTVMGYCHKYGKTVSLNEAQGIGQRASRLSKERGVSIGKTSDPRFGEVNTYHMTILNELVKG